MARDERKLARRLDAAKGGQARRGDGPQLRGNPRLEFAERTRAMPYGGVGTMLELARDVGPMAKLDSELGVLERPHPYTDADQVMNIALNILCGGRVLDDIEVRRNDRVFLDALGARSNPDPTTAGDDCRRIETEDDAEFDYQPTKASKSYRMLALRKTIDEERGQLCDRHLAQRDRILRMELRTFVQTLMWTPVQVLHTGRRLACRVLASRPDLPILFHSTQPSTPAEPKTCPTHWGSGRSALERTHRATKASQP